MGRAGGTYGSEQGANTVKRVGQVIGIRPEHIAEYERIHAEVWPEVLDNIRRHNITNYSIFRHGNLLFAYYEYVGDDYETDMANLGNDAKNQEWWAVTEPMQQPLDDRASGEWWKTIQEVFHTD